MNFNVDRIAVLAGLSSAGRSGIIKEGAPVTPAPGAKPAAPSAPAMKAPPVPAPKAVPAKAAPPAPAKEGDYMDEEHSEGYHAEGDMEEYHDTMGGMGYDDMVYEVDETQLMEALVDMREKRLEESKVRSAVRDELISILNSRESGSRWLYGDRQPSNSGSGKISRGFLGPGFR